MRLRRQPERDVIDEPGVLPLINVVFLLLIFFLLAGRIATPEAADIAPPTSTQAPSERADPSTIVVQADGAVRYNGAIADLMAAATAVAWAPNQGKVIVRADRNAPAGRVLEVAAALRAATVEQSRLVVEVGR